MALTLINHWLNGEEHAFAKLHPFVRRAVMQDAGGRMEHLAQPMAAKVTDHRKPVFLGIALDSVADIALSGPGPDHRDAAYERFMGYFDQPSGFYAHFADRIHAA